MSDCIKWWGTFNDGGYGHVHNRKRPRILAHRLIWQECFGEIPAGYHVHHDCENRACVNPEHLRLLTSAEHGRLHHPRQTHCKRGHPFDERNRLLHPDGWMRCKRCHADRMAGYRRAA